jgi:trehalose-6-phosphate synthase
VKSPATSTAPMAKLHGHRFATSTGSTAAAYLRGLYRSARAALVTPLRDGMNLVAKEYIAAQDPDDPGVLILSRFAGAAAELTAALLVNPYDPEAVAASIAHALSMSLDERHARHQAMFRLISENDLKSWGDRFLDALTKEGELRPGTRILVYAPCPIPASLNVRSLRAFPSERSRCP